MGSVQNSTTCHCGADADFSMGMLGNYAETLGYCVQHMPGSDHWKRTHCSSCDAELASDGTCHECILRDGGILPGEVIDNGGAP